MINVNNVLIFYCCTFKLFKPLLVYKQVCIYSHAASVKMAKMVSSRAVNFNGAFAPLVFISATIECAIGDI